MKDILEYPKNTPGSIVDIALLDLHEKRGLVVLQTFGGGNGFSKYCSEKSSEEAAEEFKKRFEQIHNVSYPRNIIFEL